MPVLGGGGEWDRGRIYSNEMKNEKHIKNIRKIIDTYKKKPYEKRN
jgi:hypothetical protein